MRRILFISNYCAGRGGISSQIDILSKCLINEKNIETAIYSTKGNPIYRIWLFLKLLYVAHQYDVLHIHACSYWGMLPVVYGITAGKLWRKYIIITYHGGGAEEYFEKHSAFARKWLNQADKVIVLNGFLEKVFARYRIPSIIIPNVIKLKSDIYCERLEIRPRFISVRTLTKEYRVDLILKAFQHVFLHYPDATLDILGDGDKRAELEQFVRENNLKGVHFHGQVPNERIYDYLKNNDILLSSPIVDNMPVSIMEAMNAGLLVVSSNVGGVPYMIDDGRSGLLFENGSAEQMAEKIEWALMHQQECRRMIKNAHNDVMKYEWGNNKNILTIYESI